MECFYHAASSAVGVCKSCGRGLCRGCATEVANGLACPGRCEREASDVNVQTQEGRGALTLAAIGWTTTGLAVWLHGFLLGLPYSWIVGAALVAPGLLMMLKGWRARAA